MKSLGTNSGMSEATARLLIRAFAHQYRMTDAGDFVNKIGEAAPSRTLELVWEAQAVLADAA